MAVAYRYADFVSVLGGTELHLGWIVGVGWIGSVAMRLSLGRRIDDYGPRWVWLVCLTLLAATCFAHLTIGRYDGPAVYLLRIAYCTAMAGTFSASTTFVLSRVTGPRMAEVIALLGTSGFVGMMLGTHLGDWLCGAEASPEGVVRMFVAAGVCSLAAIPFAWRATRRLQAPTPRKRERLMGLVSRYQPGLVLLVGAVTGAAISLPPTFLRPFASELHIPRIGVFFTVVAITAVAARVFARRLPEQLGLNRMMLVGLGLMGTSQLLFLVVGTEWQLVLPGLVYGTAQAILYPVITASGCGAFPVQHRGLGTAIVLASMDFGQFLGAPAGGMVLHVSQRLGLKSYPTMFSVMAAALVVTAIVFALRLRRSRALLS
jgi:MFS family permease